MSLEVESSKSALGLAYSTSFAKSNVWLTLADAKRRASLQKKLQFQLACILPACLGLAGEANPTSAIPDASKHRDWLQLEGRGRRGRYAAGRGD